MSSTESTDTTDPHLTNFPKLQLIGEEIGPKRVLQSRLFKTQHEAKIWTRAAIGRRFRLARVGSVAWIRALDEEIRAAQIVDRDAG